MVLHVTDYKQQTLKRIQASEAAVWEYSLTQPPCDGATALQLSLEITVQY